MSTVPPEHESSDPKRELQEVLTALREGLQEILKRSKREGGEISHSTANYDCRIVQLDHGISVRAIHKTSGNSVLLEIGPDGSLRNIEVEGKDPDHPEKSKRLLTLSHGNEEEIAELLATYEALMPMLHKVTNEITSTPTAVDTEQLTRQEQVRRILADF